MRHNVLAGWLAGSRWPPGAGGVPVSAAPVAGGALCRLPVATVSVHSRTPLQATAQKPPLRDGSRPLDGTPRGECTETVA
jgi:hypothetical protein